MLVKFKQVVDELGGDGRYRTSTAVCVIDINRLQTIKGGGYNATIHCNTSKITTENGHMMTIEGSVEHILSVIDICKEKINDE